MEDWPAKECPSILRSWALPPGAAHRALPRVPGIIKHEYAPNMKEAHELAKTVGVDFLPLPDYAGHDREGAGNRRYFLW